MKKWFLLIFTAISIAAIMSSKVYATDITVGATTWYSWNDVTSEGDKSYDPDPIFFYGPALAVKFNDDFNLTFVFLYGKFNMKVDDPAATPPESEVKMNRYDSDLALNYRLNDYFKIFAGVKYLGYRGSGMDRSGFGPGLGISYTYPITNDLFVLANLSGFHLWTDSNDEDENNKTCYDYGINSNLSIAYYMADISTTISLGGRFQYVKQDYNTDQKITAKFYGVTLTATYTFSI